MTVSTAPTPLSYSGNGSTTAFPITWKYNAKSHVVVVLRSSSGTETMWVLNTNYTLTDPGDSGTLTALVAPASGETLVITLEPPNTQTSDIPVGGDFPASTVEDGLDLAAQRDAKVEALFLRALRVPRSDSRTDDDLELPIDTERAGNFLAFDSNGDPIATAGTSPSGSPVSAFMETVLDDTTAAAARSTLGFPTIAAKGDIMVGTAADTLARKAVGANGTLLTPNSSSTDGLVYLDAHFGQEALIGGYITASVSGNALTFAVKTNAGNDPSTTEPVYALFRSATAGTAGMALLPITAATSLTISSGSTIGTTSGVASRTWCVGFNDASTFRLGAINCSTSTAIYPLSDDILASSTAEGGAGAADSAGVIYTGTAVTTKPMRVLGYIESTQATAGTWATTPSKIQAWTPGMRLPGDTVQVVISQSGSMSTGTTLFPLDNTIPQNNEGDEVLSVSMTPTSAINHLLVEHAGVYASNANTNYVVALFRDSTANALAASIEQPGATANSPAVSVINHSLLAGSTSSTTLKIRAGATDAGTLTFNGINGAAYFGGVMNSYLRAREVMG